MTNAFTVTDGDKIVYSYDSHNILMTQFLVTVTLFIVQTYNLNYIQLFITQ